MSLIEFLLLIIVLAITWPIWFLLLIFAVVIIVGLFVAALWSVCTIFDVIKEIIDTIKENKKPWLDKK